VVDIPLEVIPLLLYPLSAIQSTLAARLVSSQAFGNPPPAAFPEHDHLLTVQAAAAKLGVSEDWLYRRAAKLPFTVRLGPHRLRFSARGMDRYIRQRQGR
jgi:predicted DNA-binding transcriptional regulator AlpA